MLTGNQDLRFPWIVWDIWKARNDKVFRGLDRDSLVVLRNAETEALIWESAQAKESIPSQNDQEHYRGHPTYHRLKCYIDGSSKESDRFFGRGWYSFQELGTNIMMGATNYRRSLSPLHAEFEALGWAMVCMLELQKTEVAFATDCSELVKMVSTPTEWPAFEAHLEELQILKTEFSFSP